MIPFLKKRDEASISAPADKVQRKPDEGAEEDYDGLTAAAEDLCNAVHAKDYKSAAAALRAAFEMLEMEPHKEGEHT